MSDLFACADAATWRSVYDKYWDVVDAKAKVKKPGKLLSLDKWYSPFFLFYGTHSLETHHRALSLPHCIRQYTGMQTNFSTGSHQHMIWLHFGSQINLLKIRHKPQTTVVEKGYETSDITVLRVEVKK